MPPGRLPGEVFRACPTGKRPRGRPRTRWRDYVFRLAWERLGVPPEELEEVAREREISGWWEKKLSHCQKKPQQQSVDPSNLSGSAIREDSLRGASMGGAGTVGTAGGGSPKLRNTCWKRTLAVCMAVGSPFMETNLQALEKPLTMTMTVVNPPELGKEVGGKV
ncbi:hypothetical protein QTP70_027532 [Hemibagrus guttatus]|uniref:Uncharacterized protein n=1 Tax=Hemibagrus guttatus TaxID=175788 RepID=A0AAE0QDF5_9TELE|nr:hypothetical protein QTP70_027532 [Hemibagrus guttatus]